MGALLLVHAASNLTNTYFDFVSGRDTKKVREGGRDGVEEEEMDGLGSIL
jgi:1,4-dihydroxy-2-naphthoate octaprenyltransferase